MNWEADWLKGRQRLTPGKVAVIDADCGGQWTYQALNERASRLAARLEYAGIAKGDRVALLCPNHVAYFDFMFACAKLGTIFVPLNWRLSGDELQWIMEDCQPKIFGYHSDYEEWASAWKGAVKLCVDEPMYEAAMSQAANDTFRFEDAALADPYLMIYTGGTTGKPKGVLLTHTSVWWNAVNTILSWGLSDRDTTLTCMPMFHTGGINALTLPILMAGGTVVISPQFDPVRTIEHLVCYACTVVLLVPTMYHMVVQTDQFQQAAFRADLTFISGGAPCPLTIYDAFARRGLRFKEGYGMTEAGPNNFYISSEEAAVKRGSVGKAMLLNHVKIVGADGQDAADGEVGEIWLRGHHLFAEYWNNPAATEQALHEGWLLTGDLGRRDAEGYVYIMGRKKDMIISGGENIYPAEVEQTLLQCPDVREAVVVGVADEKWGESVVAAVTLQSGAAVTPESLRQLCYERLGKFKVPKQIVIWEQLPKTAVGKIDKQEVTSMLL
jgi:fatty-acyl-CoA synthase